MNKKATLLGLTTLLALPLFVFGQEDVAVTEDASVTNATTTRREITDEEVRESISEISTSVENLDQDAKNVESDVRLEIKDGVDKAILEIRAQDDTIEAYQLQNAVSRPREEAFEALRNTLNTSAPSDYQIVENIARTIDEAVSNIEVQLEIVSDIDVSLTQARENIDSILENFSDKVARNQAIIEERGGVLLDQDTDGDGLSDYDEIYIYKTDPEKAKTIEGDLNDAEKVLAGINPASERAERINYVSPKEDTEGYVVERYTVENIQKVDEGLEFRGKALPNSITTLYIFSTPVIVTVKTDSRGEWTYTLDKELENGQHEIYVATVNNSGKILARSNTIPFTQTAEAAALGAFASVGDVPEEGTGNFFQDNFNLIVVAIVLIGILITMSLFGKRTSKDEKPRDFVKNPVNPRPDLGVDESVKINSTQSPDNGSVEKEEDSSDEA
jgi:hypothetical protein